MDVTIHHVGVYRKPERYSALQPSPSIGLVFSGFRYFRAPGVDLRNPTPFICILPGNQSLDFDCTHLRENWTLLLSSPHLRQAPQVASVEIYCQRTWVELPKHTAIVEELVPGWRMEMQSLRDAFFSSLPHDRLRIETGVMNLLRYIIDQHERPSTTPTPAMHFKRLLDEDNLCEHTLTTLSQHCGYSSDHLRVLFIQEFGVTPLEYRNRRRMAKAMELIANSHLAANEIAEQLGFHHASHFSMAFRHAFHLTPREAIHRFRQ